jgi:hypothetical protein
MDANKAKQLRAQKNALTTPTGMLVLIKDALDGTRIRVETIPKVV